MVTKWTGSGPEVPSNLPSVRPDRSFIREQILRTSIFLVNNNCDASYTLFGLLNTKTHFKCPSILRLEIINMVIVVYADANTFTKKRQFFVLLTFLSELHNIATMKDANIGPIRAPTYPTWYIFQLSMMRPKNLRSQQNLSLVKLLRIDQKWSQMMKWY